MILFADTNWLAALYYETEHTATADRYMQRVQRPLTVTPPIWLEARNVFARLSGQANGAAWRALRSDLGGRVVLEPVAWPEIATAAEKLMDRFAHKARLGTFDCLALAAAQLCGATHFLSFDTASSARALAHVLKLQVFPQIAATDKALAAKLRQGPPAHPSA